MKLNQFEKVRGGARTRYVASVPDIHGSEDFQLVVAGPDVLIKRILKDTDFNITIDPNGTKEDWQATQKLRLQRKSGAMKAPGSAEKHGRKG